MTWSRRLIQFVVMVYGNCHQRLTDLKNSLKYMARVIVDGDFSESFPVTYGVKPGCVLAPTLFSVLFVVMMMFVIEDLEIGVHIRFRIGGVLFNLRTFKSKTIVLEELAKEFLLDQFSKACKGIGLSISLSRTEVMCR